MQAPKAYKTKQRQVILQALQAMPANHATAENVLEMLKQQGEEVGLATVYRNLDKLVNEGLVLKYTLPDGMRACYQYLDSCAEHAHHCHVICTGCGQVSHLECEHVDELAAHLLADHHLTLDRHKTVLYGLCASCAAK
ncbi:transcriptional repressor [Ruminococcaceae bacterium OttesenSCG-928-A16]|nr:transcriptional repressor [Ruminococcaceae bacterium OttesenSCG-928-A16]